MPKTKGKSKEPRKIVLIKSSSLRWVKKDDNDYFTVVLNHTSPMTKLTGDMVLRVSPSPFKGSKMATSSENWERLYICSDENIDHLCFSPYSVTNWRMYYSLEVPSE